MAGIQLPFGSSKTNSKNLVQYSVDIDRDDTINARKDKLELKNEEDISKFDMQKFIVGIEDSETIDNIEDSEGNLVNFKFDSKNQSMGTVIYETLPLGIATICPKTLTAEASESLNMISRCIQNGEYAQDKCIDFLNQFGSHVVNGKYEVGGIFEIMIVCDASVKRRKFREIRELFFEALENENVKNSFKAVESGQWYTIKSVFDAANESQFSDNELETIRIRMAKFGGVPHKPETYYEWFDSVHANSKFGCFPLATKDECEIIPIWLLINDQILDTEVDSHKEVAMSLKEAWLKELKHLPQRSPGIPDADAMQSIIQDYEFAFTHEKEVPSPREHNLDRQKSTKEDEARAVDENGYLCPVQPSLPQASNSHPIPHPGAVHRIPTNTDPDQSQIAKKSSFQNSTRKSREHIYEEIKPHLVEDNQQCRVINASVDDDFVATQPYENPKNVLQRKAKSSKAVQQQFHDLFKDLNLLSFQQKKISLQDVMKIRYISSDNKHHSIQEIVWPLLEKIIMMDHRARDSELSKCIEREHLTKQTRVVDNRHTLCGEDDEEDNYHPLDIFIAIFSRCDPLLQQLVTKKMFMCRQAVPFLCMNDQGKLTLYLWPLETVCIEWRNEDGTACEESFTKHPMDIISFVRMGSLYLSKSLLMNEILGSKGHHIFCNRESPNGWNHRSISNGLVEISHFLPSGKNSDSFRDELIFFNLRGDLEDHSKQKEILLNISSVIVLLVDIDELFQKQGMIQETFKFTKNGILVLTCKQLPPRQSPESCYEFCEKLTTQSKMKVQVLKAFTKRRMKTVTEMKPELLHLINSRGRKNIKKSLSDHVSDLEKSEVFIDKKFVKSCLDAMKYADKVLKFDKKNLASYKKDMLPLQGEHWHKWSDLKKQKQRMTKTRHGQDTSYEKEQIKMEMKDLRRKQQKLCHVMSPLMENFIEKLNKTIKENNSDAVMFFIQWLKIKLDQLSREQLPGLHREYQSVWDTLAQIKGKSPSKTKELQNKLENIERAIADTAFGFEHIMREIGQIFEACKEIKGHISKLQGVWNRLPDMAAKLLLRGIPFELMDGDAASVAMEWVCAVIASLEKEIGSKKKVFILSVIGIQSSGKSTLLNTMFGLEFAVSAGRCTRGIYAQLLAIDDKESHTLPFDYILVLDSEGLRAPELQTAKYEHDNELATFVIGLADLTLINLKGENTAEMRDVLQIAVHAFLRMKRADKNKHQRCIFIHQNVAALNAKERMIHGLKKLQDNLDQMTREAAKADDLSSTISSFSQVIEFQGQKDVYYMSDLWSGDPPMAAVNPGYSEKALEVRSSLLKRFIDEKPQVLTLGDFATRIKDLWRAILADDFVFSFRNSIAIKAHLSLEREFAQLKFEIEEDAMGCKIQKLSQITKSGNVKDLDEKASAAIREIKSKVINSLSEKQRKLRRFFDNTEYQDILNDWREDKRMSLKQFAENVESRLIQEIQSLREVRYDTLRHTDKAKDHEKALMVAANKLALELRDKHPGKQVPDIEKDREFDKMWNELIEQESPKVSMRDRMEEILLQKLAAEGHSIRNLMPILKTKRTNTKLSESIEAKDICNDDFIWKSRGFLSNITNKFANAVMNKHAKAVSNAVGDIFSALDVAFRHLCSSSSMDFLSKYKHFVDKVMETFETHVTTPNPDWQFFITRAGKAHFVSVAISIAINYYETKYSSQSLDHQSEYTQQIVKDMKNILSNNFANMGMLKYLTSDIYDVNSEEYLQLLDDPNLPYTQHMQEGIKEKDIESNHLKLNIPCITHIMQSLDEKVEDLCSTDSKYSESHGNMFVNSLMRQLENHTEGPCCYKFTKDYSAKFAVLAVRFAVTKFVAMNIQFDTIHSSAANLDKYKAKIKQFFMNKVKDSEITITAADLFYGKIIEEVQDLVTTQLAADIQSKIMRDIGFSKHDLMVKIMKDLTEKEDFNGFMLYINDAFSYASKWVKTFTDANIFTKGQSGRSQYSDMAKAHIDSMVGSLTKSMNEMVIVSTSMDEWLREFCTKIDIFTESDFRHVSDYEVSDLANFTAYVLKRLQDTNIQGHFDGINENNVDLKSQNPYADVTARLWGCKAQCPFCYEPCKETEENHEGKQHTCLQHRVDGASGFYDHQTRILSVRLCSVLVTTDRRFRCSSRTCTCGEGPKSEEIVWHPYNDYHKYQPDWDIAPDDGAEMSKFWKWFMNKYVDKVVEYYGLEKPEIPATWNEISKQKAIESLNEYLG